MQLKNRIPVGSFADLSADHPLCFALAAFFLAGVTAGYFCPQAAALSGISISSLLSSQFGFSPSLSRFLRRFLWLFVLSIFTLFSAGPLPLSLGLFSYSFFLGLARLQVRFPAMGGFSAAAAAELLVFVPLLFFIITSFALSSRAFSGFSGRRRRGSPGILLSRFLISAAGAGVCTGLELLLEHYLT